MTPVFCHFLKKNGLYGHGKDTCHERVMSSVLRHRYLHSKLRQNIAMIDGLCKSFKFINYYHGKYDII